MNRIRFFSKITYTVSILLTMALTLSCSSDDKDNSSSVIFACQYHYWGMCEEYTKFKNKGTEQAAKDGCGDMDGDIVSKCPRDNVKRVFRSRE